MEIPPEYDGSYAGGFLRLNCQKNFAARRLIISGAGCDGGTVLDRYA